MEPTKTFPALPVNHCAFQKIDSHQKAYLLGFLLADGCVLLPRPGRSRSRVNLRIKAEDIKVCRMLQDIAGGNLRMIENGYRIEWALSSDPIAQDLTALGVTPRKSLTASLRWDLVPSELHGSVLAGLIDGDGHLRCDRAKRRMEITLVTGSAALKDQLLALFPFFKAVEVPPPSPRRRTLYRVEVGTNRERLKALTACAYSPLPFPILDRKQAVLDRMRGYLADRDAYDQRMAGIPILKASGLTIQEIADLLGTSRRPVLARLKALGIKSQVIVFTQADREEMKRLHDLGATVLEIHAAVGKGTEQAVRYHLQRMGCLVKKTLDRTRHPPLGDTSATEEPGGGLVSL